MLDESFRSRVQEVASVAPSTLDEAAQERILSRVAAEGPGHVRAGRRARLAYFLAGPALAAAAAVTLFAVRHGSSSDIAPPAPVAAVASHPAPACGARAVPSGASAGFVSGAAGAQLDLGSVAFAVADTGSAVRLSVAEPCRTELELGAGRVTIHAKDLGGGELKVLSRGVEVTVHGTIFAVTRTADAVTVEVAEGRVQVTDRAGAHWVSTGGRLQLSDVGAAEGPLGADRAQAIRAVVGVPLVVGLDALQPVPPEATAPPAAPGTRAAPGARASAPAAAPAVVGVAQVDLGTGEAERTVAPEPAAPAPAAPAPAKSVDSLALAEEARRAGDFARARELYRQAGEGRGVTAEAAWVALARMELSLGHAGSAREATKRRQERFGQGTLAPEALWIDVRTYRQTGDLGRARELAADLVARWPSSPQARAARQWLSGE